MKKISVLILCMLAYVASCHSQEPTCKQENMMSLGNVCLNLEAKPDTIIPYKTTSERTLNLHVFNAHGVAKNTQSPALLLFHGGGWNSGTPKQMYDQADYFAKNGITTISVEYRLYNIDNTPPRVSLMDAKSAFRWVLKNAAQLGVNPELIAAGGASAGGHLAAALATVNEFNEPNETILPISPKALILFNPVIDNSEAGYGYERVEPYWHQFSPLHNIAPGHPPTIAFLGTNDKYIPVTTGEAYRDKIRAVGAKAELYIYPEKQHGFFNRKRSVADFKDTVLKAHVFLENSLKP